jgi:HlyD family secretion protein
LKSEKMSRSTWLTILAVLVLAGGYAFWRRAEVADARGYVSATVDRGTIASTVTATGTVNPVTMVQVGTYVSGPIQAIYADFNSPVTKGQLVAKIDPAPFQVKVAQAEANLANAEAKVEKDRADLALKKITLGRNRELLAAKLVSQSDVDAATSAYDQARAQLALDEAGVQQATAALQEARINLAYTAITSPVDGVVVSRNVDVGQTVAASFQTPTLFLIAQDLTKMQVDTNVSESDIGDVRPDQPVAFTVDAYPDKAFHGTVAQVRNAPTILQNVVTYDVVVAVDNPDLELKPGMTATVAITTAERDGVLRVPLRALRFNPAGAGGAPAAGEAERPADALASTSAAGGREAPGVWILQPAGTLHRVEVQVGLRDEQYGEVLSDGLAVGDRIAVAYRSGKRKEEASGPPSFMPGRRH